MIGLDVVIRLFIFSKKLLYFCLSSSLCFCSRNFLSIASLFLAALRLSRRLSHFFCLKLIISINFLVSLKYNSLLNRDVFQN